jgi:hypothetical protein
MQLSILPPPGTNNNLGYAWKTPAYAGVMSMTVSPVRRHDEDAIAGAAAASLCKRSARPWVLAATILASSMVFIDGTVVNVALPALQRAFGASASDVQWVVESYALFLSALLLVGATQATASVGAEYLSLAPPYLQSPPFGVE